MTRTLLESSHSPASRPLLAQTTTSRSRVEAVAHRAANRNLESSKVSIRETTMEMIAICFQIMTNRSCMARILALPHHNNTQTRTKMRGNQINSSATNITIMVTKRSSSKHHGVAKLVVQVFHQKTIEKSKMWLLLSSRCLESSPRGTILEISMLAPILLAKLEKSQPMLKLIEVRSLTSRMKSETQLLRSSSSQHQSTSITLTSSIATSTLIYLSAPKTQVIADTVEVVAL